MADTVNNTMKLETVELSEDRVNGNRKKEYFYRCVHRYLTVFSFSLKSTHEK